MNNENVFEYVNVKISLDRYNNFLKSQENEEKLYKTFEDIRKIVENPKFDIDDEIHSKIFKIYERLCIEL